MTVSENDGLGSIVGKDKVARSSNQLFDTIQSETVILSLYSSGFMIDWATESR